MAMTRSNRVDHIRITSHPAPGARHNFPIAWGAASARERGPVIGTVSRPQDRNVIGTQKAVGSLAGLPSGNSWSDPWKLTNDRRRAAWHIAGHKERPSA
jgi:hypothetical protein